MRFHPSCFVFRSFALVAVAALLAVPRLAAGINAPGFPAFPAGEYKPADLGPKEPEIVVEFPSTADTHGVANGTARVSILVDAEGKAVDFLVTGCTDKAFGAALLARAKDLKFQAASFKGAAVPSRYDLGYNFKSNAVTVDPMDVARLKMEKTTSGNLACAPVMEKNLDHPLEFLTVAKPTLPAGFPATGANPVRVLVTFYVDEAGHVRVPTVESAVSPELIPAALDAVLHWSFKPPQVKGQPVLVFAGRAVPFNPPPK